MSHRILLEKQQKLKQRNVQNVRIHRRNQLNPINQHRQHQQHQQQLLKNKNFSQLFFVYEHISFYLMILLKHNEIKKKRIKK
jgi:hypothetical protein